MNNYTQQGTDGMVQLWAEMFGWWLDLMGPWAPPALREAVRMYGNRSSRSAAGNFSCPPGFPFPFPPGFLFPSPFPQQGFSYPPGPPYPHTAPYPSSPSQPQSVVSSVMPAPSSSLGVTLALDAKKPVEVHVELSADADISQLAVQDLASMGIPDRITDVRLETGYDGFPLLRLSVGAELPPGTYSGMVTDRRNSGLRGMVRVVVRASPKST